MATTDLTRATRSTGHPALQPRKRIWVQHVDAELQALRMRVDAARARGLDKCQEAVADGVSDLIARAQNAANRQDPIPSRVANWWRGTLVEASYRNLHAARAQVVELYERPDLDAEIPAVVARLHSTLDRDDPRCVSSADLKRLDVPHQRAWLRRLIEDSYEAVDLKHAQVRSFRNILLGAAAVISLLLVTAIAIIASNPTFVPLCFPADDVTTASQQAADVFNCPTTRMTNGPQSSDVLIVALLGLLGGALAATVAIRNLHGTSIVYDVPVALAWLKVPLGAFVAILGLVAIRGGFVPGLSALDSQDQILAYALLLGFSQQLFTGVLDSRAQALVQSIPSKDVQSKSKVPAKT